VDLIIQVIQITISKIIHPKNKTKKLHHLVSNAANLLLKGLSRTNKERKGTFLDVLHGREMETDAMLNLFGLINNYKEKIWREGKKNHNLGLIGKYLG
jgi:hypothetical protein